MQSTEDGGLAGGVRRTEDWLEVGTGPMQSTGYGALGGEGGRERGGEREREREAIRQSKRY